LKVGAHFLAERIPLTSPLRTVTSLPAASSTKPRLIVFAASNVNVYAASCAKKKISNTKIKLLIMSPSKMFAYVVHRTLKPSGLK